MPIKKSIAIFLTFLILVFSTGISMAEYCKDLSTKGHVTFLCHSQANQNCCIDHTDERLSTNLEIPRSNFPGSSDLFHVEHLNSSLSYHLSSKDKNQNYFKYSPLLTFDIPVIIQCFRI